MKDALLKTYQGKREKIEKVKTLVNQESPWHLETPLIRHIWEAERPEKPKSKAKGKGNYSV